MVEKAIENTKFIPDGHEFYFIKFMLPKKYVIHFVIVIFMHGKKLSLAVLQFIIPALHCEIFLQISTILFSQYNKIGSGVLSPHESK